MVLLVSGVGRGALVAREQLGDEGRVEVAPAEALSLEDAAVEGGGGGDAVHDEQPTGTKPGALLLEVLQAVILGGIGLALGWRPEPVGLALWVPILAHEETI